MEQAKRVEVRTRQPIGKAACDACRRKKIRCEPAGDACRQCIQAKVESSCHFTPISKTRRPRRSAPSKYIKELEARIKDMEQQLQDVKAANAANKSNIDNTNPNSAAAGDIEIEIDVDVGGDPDIHMLQEVESVEEPWTIVPEPWVHAVSFPNRLKDTPPGAFATLTTSPPTSTSQPPITPAPAFALFPPRRTAVDLPPEPTALTLVNQAFESFNHYFPIFDQASFMRSFHANYSPATASDPAWWASINVVLALGHLFSAMRTLDRRENDLACRYTQNALWVVTELIALPKSLPAIQSLLGITIALEGTPHSQLCSVVIASAMRLAQAMGLHRRNQDPTFTAAEVEERRNVFWIAYWLDKNITYLKRQPSAQDDDDIDVELPAGIISQLPLYDDDGGVGTRTSINLFNSRIALAIIQGQIYRRLYSVQAARETAAQRAVAAAHLDAILACWRASVPFEFGRNTVTALQVPVDEDVLHTIVLRLAYVDCLITVRRHMRLDGDSRARDGMTAAEGVYSQARQQTLEGETENLCATGYQHLPVQNDGLSLPTCPISGSQVSAFIETEDLCVTESREAVALIQKLPKGDYACVWLLMDNFSAAVTVLLENVIRDPTAILARSDLALVEPSLLLLEDLAGRQHSADAPKLHEQCKELSRKAREAVDNVDGGFLI